MRRWLLGCFLVLVVLIGSPVLWIWKELVTPYYGSRESDSYVEIPRGASSGTIGRLLEQAGILRHSLPFVVYLRLTSTAGQLQAGEYQFNSPVTPVEVAKKLIRGEVVFHSITIPEGLTASETVELIARSGLGDLGELENAVHRTDWIQDLDPQSRDLEGYLFPETYRFSRRASSEEIVKRMVHRFREVFSSLSEEFSSPQKRNVRAIVTLASMVEKEASIESERGLVASVLINRLERSMPLACDPTLIYALKKSGKYDGNIRKAHLQMDSPYNTYIREGLPPSPIANPGASSLKAALAPPKTTFLFFVSRNDGTHEFSKDFASHAKAVAQFQKVPRHEN